MALRHGDDGQQDDRCSFQQYNRIKNCWSMSDPRTKITNPQAGMVAHDTDSDKVYVYDGGAWVDMTEASTLDVTFTAGENISIRNCVYVEMSGALGTAGRVYQCDADISQKSSDAWVVGFATAAETTGNSIVIRMAGIITGFAGLTAGKIQYASATAGAVTETEPGNSRIVGVAFSSSTIFVDIRGPNDAVSSYSYDQGYFAGGHTTAVVVTADKLTFGTDSTAACTSADLSQARRELAGSVSEIMTKGYFMGGYTTAVVVTADKITFSSDATAACTSANLPNITERGAGISANTTQGYILGGYSSANSDKAYKVTYSSDATAACTSANLSTVRQYLVGISEGVSNGYVGGGNSGSIIATGDKITFSSDSTAACTISNLSQARQELAGIDGEGSKGYYLGGDTGANVTTTDKITYSSDSTVACTSANLTNATQECSGSSEGESQGYVSGGESGAVSDKTYKITFSSDTEAACTTANLSQARRYISGAAISGSAN